MVPDDGTVGGSAETVKQYLEVIKEERALLDLKLNEKKSEVFLLTQFVRDLIVFEIPGAKLSEPSVASLLGYP